MKFIIALALAATASAVESESESWNLGHHGYAPEYSTGYSYEEECPDLEGVSHLDTSNYQEMSAFCKKKLIWERTT